MYRSIQFCIKKEKNKPNITQLSSSRHASCYFQLCLKSGHETRDPGTWDPETMRPETLTPGILGPWYMAPYVPDIQDLGPWDPGTWNSGTWNWDLETWDFWPLVPGTSWPYTQGHGNGTLESWDLQMTHGTDCIDFICEVNFDNQKLGHVCQKLRVLNSQNKI